MKKFTIRPTATWNSAPVLLRLLEDFFDDEEIPVKSLSHLYSWLNTDFIDIEQKKTLNSEIRQLLESAERFCECWVIEQGFVSDRSFARYYLDKYHKKEADSASPTLPTTVNIVLDTHSDS